jgi:hypothetical protein
VNKVDFTPEVVRSKSMAAAELCDWVLDVYEFAKS